MALVHPIGVEGMSRPAGCAEKVPLLCNPPRNPSPVKDWIKSGVWGLGLGNLFNCLQTTPERSPTKAFEFDLSYWTERAFSLTKGEMPDVVEEDPQTVAFTGVPGSHSEAAAVEMQPGCRTVPCGTYDEALQKLSHGEVEFAILPVENSLEGPVEGMYERIPSYPNTHIVAELAYKVEHCLVALPGVDKHSIRKVYSHEQTLARCDAFLQSNNFEPVPFEGTAGAAELLKKNDLKTSGALATRRAAEIHGLEILDSSVESSNENVTRYALLSRTPAAPPDPVDMNPEEHKVSVMFTLKPGTSLSNVLSVFSGVELDIESVESRPVVEAPVVQGPVGRKFHRRFFVDVTGSIGEPLCKLALHRVEDLCREFRILGSYARDLNL